MRYVLLVCLLFVAPACGSAGKAPPNLSPQATVAWHGTRAIRVMDLLRDTAIDAEKASPPIISTQAARQVVTWHRTAITIVHAAPAGWQATVLTSLDTLSAQMEAADKTALAFYLKLVESVIRGLTS